MKYAKLKWVVSNDILVSFATGGILETKVSDELVHVLATKPIRKYLVTTGGPGEMTSVQRKQVADVFSKKKIGVAVVTDERIVRHFVTAISWLGVDIKAFAWKDLRDAVRHLGAVGAHEERLIQIVQDLKKACEMER
jgi:hypothetical protein